MYHNIFVVFLAVELAALTLACPFFADLNSNGGNRADKLTIPENIHGNFHRRLLREVATITATTAAAAGNIEYTSPPTEAPIGECPRPRPATPDPTVSPTTTLPGTPAQPTGEPTGEPSSSPTDEIWPEESLLANPQCVNGPLDDVSSEEFCEILTSIKDQFMALMGSADNLFKARVFGASLRVCFHDAGEVLLSDPNDRLGPDGCLQTVNRDSSGLVELEEEINIILEPIWQEHCTKISRADFWAFWGKLVIEFSASEPVTVEFFSGRTDNEECSAGVGRLPVAFDHTLDEVQRVFLSQMGLTLEDVVVLMGAHSVGHVTPAFSDFGHPIDDPGADSVDFNAWDFTSWVLDNSFYHALLGSDWDLMPETSDHKQAFSSGPLIMLNTDMSLAFVLVDEDGSLPEGLRCGRTSSCSRQSSTESFMNSLASSNTFFIEEFSKSFTKMCNVGYGYTLGSDTFVGKLGTLSRAECNGI